MEKIVLSKPQNPDDDEAKNEFIRRLFSSFLDLIVIAHFQQEPFSGYDVVQFAHKKFDIMLSAGTVYSTLYAMERGKLLISSSTPNKRVFKATEKGLLMSKLAGSPEVLVAFFKQVKEK